MLKFKKEHFKRLRFNPLSEFEMLRTYEDLSQIIDIRWGSDPNLDKILRFIIMVYDQESAIFQGEKEINMRRTFAAEAAGFDMNDKTLLLDVYTNRYVFVSEVEQDGLKMRDSYAYMPQLVTAYLRRFSCSKEHAAIVATEFSYWEGILKMMDPITGGNSKQELESVQKKQIIRDDLPKSLALIKALYKEFFAGDEELAEAGEESILHFNAESVAHVLQNKKRKSG